MFDISDIFIRRHCFKPLDHLINHHMYGRTHVSALVRVSALRINNIDYSLPLSHKNSGYVGGRGEG